MMASGPRSSYAAITRGSPSSSSPSTWRRGTSTTSWERVEPGASAGVGYLLKDRVADVAEFVAALERLAAGGTALDPEVVSELLSASRRSDALSRLTDREREVLALMAEGRSNSAMAVRLVVTQRAVEKHISNIFHKLGLPAADADHRRVLAVLRYLG